MLPDHTAEIAELRQQNERLRRKVDFVFDHLGLSYADQDVPLYVLHAQELIRAGQYGDALRVIREHTAVGIVEARSIIVDLSKRLGVPIPSEKQMGTSRAVNPWDDERHTPPRLSADPILASGWDEPLPPAKGPVDSFAAWRE